jgi:16S rRNA (guanine966-N2)-methyltransferase|tara:strand:- start:44 stop:604 length:561 start_codon:yes stop_codon:yes gene_type:complete
MRIISGSLKGKQINLPKDKQTRPLRDMVKESIFNILNHSNKFNCNIENSEILDLFSGSGSFGLECISRGAKKVYFNENYPDAVNILRKNIIALECEAKSTVLEIDCFKIKDSINCFDNKFDTIFMDPPFKEEKINLLLENILDLKILKENGVIIIHRNKKKDEKFTNRFNIIESRNYGISKIIFGN